MPTVVSRAKPVTCRAPWGAGGGRQRPAEVRAAARCVVPGKKVAPAHTPVVTKVDRKVVASSNDRASRNSVEGSRAATEVVAVSDAVPRREGGGNSRVAGVVAMVEVADVQSGVATPEVHIAEVSRKPVAEVVASPEVWKGDERREKTSVVSG